MIRFFKAAATFAALAASIFLTSCGTVSSSSPAARTGIQGTVAIGPTCPVERVNSPCPPRPVSATVVVKNEAGKEVTRVRSGSDGHFRIDLAPGHYVLRGEGPTAAALPRPIPVGVVVVAGAYTTVAVQFDSGIR